MRFSIKNCSAIYCQIKLALLWIKTKFKISADKAIFNFMFVFPYPTNYNLNDQWDLMTFCYKKVPWLH